MADASPPVPPAADNPFESNDPPAPPSPVLAVVPNPSEHPDDTRRKLAQYLVALLAVVVVMILVGWLRCSKTTDEVEAIGLVLSPVVTLVGTVLGFYFSGSGPRTK